MEIQGVDEENEISQLAQSNEESTICIEDVRTLHPRKLEYCRLCAMPCSCTVSIFDKQGLEMNLANKINMNLPILVTEDSRLPLHVCWDCIKQLNASINFVSQCLHAQLKIERMFKDSLKGRHSTQIPIISNEKNVDAEECSSISRSVSNQLISKEITSNDNTILSESSDLNEIIMIDTSKLIKRNEEKRRKKLSFSNRIKHNDKENISNRTLQEIPVVEISDSDNECKEADKILENPKSNSNSAASELNSNTSCSGYALTNHVNFSMTEKTKVVPSIFKKKNQLKHCCQYCEESYNWKADLFQHQALAHPALVFRCCHCDKIFYESKEDLIKHENAHQLPPLKKRAFQPWKHGKYTKKKAFSSTPRPYSNVSYIPNENMGCVKDIVAPDANWEIRDDKISGSELVASTYKDKESLGQACVSSEAFLYKNSKDSTGENSQEIMLEKSTKGEVNSDIIPKVCVRSEKNSPQGESKNPSQNSYNFNKLYCCQQCKIHFQTLQQNRRHHREHHTMRYPCRFCPRTFSLRKDLDLHESYHLSGKKHNCRKCSESFDTVDELKKHRLALHLGPPRYKCKNCHKSYYREHEYFRHIKLHSSDVCYLCEMCGKSFSNSSQMSSHRRMFCVKPVEKKLSCEFCGRMFHLQSRLRVHLRVHTGEKPYLCSVCGKAFHDSYFLKKHMESHSVARQACSFCGLLFRRRCNLVLHMKQHSTCNICNLDYSENVKAHLLHRREIHSMVAEEELMKGFRGHKLAEFANGGGKIGDFSETVSRCESCGRVFASSFWMQLHQNNHCSNRPIFRCPVCDKIMRHPESYRKHLMMHSDDKTFQCNHCPRKFDIYKNLLKHEKEHKSPKPYSCPECGKTFGSSVGLHKHLVVHSTGRIFSCNICDKTFTRQVSLMVHNSQHHALLKQVYHCSMCFQTFSQKRLAQMHVKSHVEEQKQSVENTNILIKDYNLNLGEESFAVDDCLDNVASEVLVYDSQSIESTYSEIIIVSDKMDDDVMDTSG